MAAGQREQSSRAGEPHDIEALILAERDAHKGNPDFNDGYKLGIDRAAVVARRASRAGEATEARETALRDAMAAMCGYCRNGVPGELVPTDGPGTPLGFLHTGKGWCFAEKIRKLLSTSPTPAGAETAETQSIELERAIVEFGDAHFDCGAWTSDDDEPYVKVSDRAREAEKKLRSLLAGRAGREDV
jgi:hypothetical protein